MAVPALNLHALPNLPGYALPKKSERSHRSQVWGFVNGQRMEFVEGLSHEKQKRVLAVKPAETWRSGQTLPDSTTREVYRTQVVRNHDELPAWDALDRHVLRFYGHFKEATTETSLENHRVRKCVVLYYLEDDTCQVNEPKVENCGIPQGVLVRRHRFPAPGSGYLHAANLRVNEELWVYGKCILLTDCDAFTRQHFQSIGDPQVPAVPEPQDPFTVVRAAQSARASYGQQRTYEKLYREVHLGGGHVNTEMQQFMENDGRVCRFFGVLDDLSTPKFERRPFTILYFLADDTVEVREQYPKNSGRDNFPIFFRRAKMPKVGGTIVGPDQPQLRKDQYVGLTDVAVGAEADLAGRKFFIFDADNFTRAHFKNELGIELQPKTDVQLPDPEIPRAPTPPYGGYGSWDDSMASVINLVPKVPKKFHDKLFHNEGKILRFSAKILNPRPEDAERRFVISFHLRDDCLAIHEPPQRNSGIVTGKYLEKGVHLNQNTGCLFEPKDLLPGQTIRVFNHEFEMLDMDEYTRRYAEDGDVSAAVDLQALLEKLREAMRQQLPLVRDIFRRFDLGCNNVIGVEEFKRALQKFNFQISDRNVHVVMRHFDRNQDGHIDYNEFCDIVLDEDYTLTMLQTKASLDATSDAKYEMLASATEGQRAEVEAVRNAVRRIGHVLYQRTHVVPKFYKECQHMTHLGHVTVQQVHSAFSRIGCHFEFDDVVRCVEFALPEADLQKIDYVDFLKTLVSGYHDMHNSR